MSLPLRVRSWKRSQKYAFIKKSIEQEFKSLVSESSSSSDDIGEDISDDNRVNFGQDHNCVEFNISDRACNVIELDDSSCEDSIDDFHNDGDLLGDICEYDEKNLILSPISTPEITICDVLKTYAIQCNVPRSNLRVLMDSLRPLHNDLPKDPRTILKGPTKILVEPMGKGHYYYFGIVSMVRHKMNDESEIPRQLILHFNIDGIPLKKSSNIQLWPILCRIEGLENPHPFMCAVYCGPDKADINEFFKDFVPELKEITEQEITINGRAVIIKIGNFICDCPARAYVKCIIGHTGKNGCDRCIQEGVWKGCMTFPEINAALRNDDDFLEYTNHWKQKSPLINAKVKMISQFPQDIMHLIWLGVARKLVRYFTKSIKQLCKTTCGKTCQRMCRRVSQKFRLSALQISLINDQLKTFTRYWPNDFSRKPGDLKESDGWKATQSRSFVLYTAPLILKKYLKKSTYNIVILLHIAATILVRPELCIKYNHIADDLLRKFVQRSASHFGPQFISYNVHSLIHIASDVKKNGPAESFSAFIFENELGIIKEKIKASYKPLQQLVNRTIESMDSSKRDNNCVNKKTGPIATSMHYHGPTCELSGSQYHRLQWKNTVLSHDSKNNSILISNSIVIVISNFVESPQNDIWVIGKRFQKYTDLYEKPYRSSKFGIYCVSQLSHRPVKYNLCEVVDKVLLLPIAESNSFACYPLGFNCEKK